MQKEIDIQTKERQYTKRIVSNSFYLFLRILVVTVVTLCTVRYVLRGLGMEQYGIFNAVAGIVLTGTFIIPVLATSIQRFYSFALGINDSVMLQNLFSVSINIILFLVFILCIIFETFGLWYVNYHLVVPNNILPVVNVIYQVTIFSFILTLLLVPFTAVIFSHENMKIYALLSCLDCVMKCVLAVVINYTHNNVLLLYSFGLLIIASVMLLNYAFYTCKTYKECKYHRIQSKDIYRKLLSFCGWTSYGAISGTAMIQGSVMILNFFFGPLTNAAFAVSNNLYNAFNSLANSVVLSFRPAMTKLYAQQDKEILNHLFYVNNKIILYLMGAVVVPVVFEIPIILKVWLGSVTDEMIIFSRLFIVFTLCLVMHNPISTIVQSTGQVKKYSLLVETMMLGCLPLSVILFEFHFPSYSIFVSFIICCLIAHALRLYCLSNVYSDFSFLIYLKDIILRGIIVFVITFVTVFYLRTLLENEIIRLAFTFVFAPLFLMCMTFLAGLSRKEKLVVVKIIKHRLIWHI